MSQHATASPDIAGATVIVVEDEMLITMLLEDILDDLGCRVAGSAATLRQGRELAEVAAADLAILDVNLAGEPVFPVAERLAERNIPIIFASGYGASGLPDKWKSFTVLQKPFTTDQVKMAIGTVLGR